jgi:uncharacterized protein YjeT (DUF2065 family)
MMRLQGVMLGLVVLAIGTSTLWLKQQPLLALVAAALGFVLYGIMPHLARRLARAPGSA